jgi:para-nitrobenzyl esterase
MKSIRFASTRRYPALTAAALLAALLSPAAASAAPALSAPRAQLSDGVIEGVSIDTGQTRVHAFTGVPYAAPPVGPFRWRAPQPVARWAGVRRATEFGPRCMQSDGFAKTSRSTRMSEDCLYLNIWAPPDPQRAKLPVLVYFHTGDFEGGDGSDARIDGANLAAKGMIVVTVNYRLDVFGFFAHPDAAQESGYGAAGNYGLLDQLTALRWVRENIAQFGGDREQVTIGGQGAGAVSVSAHMASPLSRGLFARAIGQSAGAFTPINFWTKEYAEDVSKAFANRLGASTLEALRSRPAEALLDVKDPADETPFGFWPTVDGYFLTERPGAVFAAGGQARVPLLVGSNSQEAHFSRVLEGRAPTPENWRLTLEEIFPHSYPAQIMALYPGGDEQEVMRSGTALASDMMFGISTRLWADLHRETGAAPVYYYFFTQPRPPLARPVPGEKADPRPEPVMGAEHGAEVEYMFDNFRQQPQYAWTDEDRKIARVFSDYVARFVKTGDPNSEGLEKIGSPKDRPSFQRDGLPLWPPAREERGGLVRQSIGSDTRSILDTDSERYRLLHVLYKTAFPNVAGMKP